MGAVNPDHYRGFSNGAEVIDITENLNFNRGNACKYLSRAGRKDDEIQDLSKSLWYTAREILRIGGQEALDSAIKELPGSKAMSPSVEALNILLNANGAEAVHSHTFEELGESQQVEGVVYRDQEGDFWTWRDGWRVYEPNHPDWGWCPGAEPDNKYGPYTKTSLSPDEVNVPDPTAPRVEICEWKSDEAAFSTPRKWSHISRIPSLAPFTSKCSAGHIYRRSAADTYIEEFVSGQWHKTDIFPCELEGPFISVEVE